MPKSIKDQMEKSELHNRLVAENLVDAAWVVDASTLKFDYITPSTHQLSGYTAEETIGTTFIDRLAPDSLVTCSQILKKELKDYEKGKRVTRTLEIELLHKTGESYWVEIKVKFFQEPGGSLKIIGISRDITPRKRVEQQLNDQNITLAEALADKERLLKEIKVLQGLLPICSGCKRIRDENGKWWPLDAYVKSHTDTQFTHTLCRDCKSVFYPELH
jgi:PAS domain S-box-containing protein